MKKLEFYVPRLDMNTNEFIMFNIFDYDRVCERLIEETKDYLHNKQKYEYSSCFGGKTLKGIKALRKMVELVLRGQFWSRVQYEFNIAEVFTDKALHKVDSFTFIEPNIKLITNLLIDYVKGEQQYELVR